MEEYCNKTLKNGHPRLLRSLYALSEVVGWNARFLLRDAAKMNLMGVWKNHTKGSL